MNESLLLKIAVITSIIGIISLFLITRLIEINDTTIERIGGGDETGNIVIQGTIKEIKQFGSATSIVIEQAKKAEIIAYDPVNLSKGTVIKVEGKIDSKTSVVTANRIERLE